MAETEKKLSMKEKLQRAKEHAKKKQSATPEKQGKATGKAGGKASAAAEPQTNEEKIQQEVAMTKDPLVNVVLRNSFYRDGFRSMIKIVFLESFAIVMLVVALVVTHNLRNPQDRYFATTADGRLIRMIPLNQPNLSQAALLSWVAQAATEVMTFGFHDYTRRLQKSSRHFTSKGWESFTSALQKSRILETVEAKQQVVTAAPRNAPVLIQEGLFQGKYRWVVSLPLMVTYQSGNARRSDSLSVTLHIERVSTLENPQGVGIDQWIAR